MTKSKELQEALKLITEKCKQPNFYEQLENQSLSNRLATLKSAFLRYVDSETINYSKTKMVEKNPERKDNLQYRHVELSKREREKAIEEMHWFIQDLEACISHLEN